MEQLETKARYKLMYKNKGGKAWRTCTIRDWDGNRVPRAVTEDKLLVIKERDEAAKMFPKVQYAILELN